jgi:hypothetical protein
VLGRSHFNIVGLGHLGVGMLVISLLAHRFVMIADCCSIDKDINSYARCGPFVHLSTHVHTLHASSVSVFV